MKSAGAMLTARDCEAVMLCYESKTRRGFRPGANHQFQFRECTEGQQSVKHEDVDRMKDCLHDPKGVLMNPTLSTAAFTMKVVPHFR